MMCIADRLDKGQTTSETGPDGWERVWKVRSDRVRAGFHALEQRRRQVALAGVGQHRDDDTPLGRLRRDLERGGEGAARRDPAEDALPVAQVARAGDGDLVG